MKRIHVLLLSSLVLSMVTSCVQSVKVFGEYTSEDPMRKLEYLGREKLRLEHDLANIGPGEQKNLLQMRLINAKYWIQKIQDSSKVLYKDYLQMMAEKTAELQEEKMEGKKHIEKQKELAAENDKLAKQYAEYVETQNQHQERLTKEKNQIIRQRDEVMQKLEEAQNLYSQALEAVAVTTQEDYELVTIPHQTDIKLLRDKMKALTSASNKNQFMDDLLTTQTNLTDLLHKVYGECELSSISDLKDLEMDHAKILMQSMQRRNEYNNRRKEILQNIKNKKLDDYIEEEIMSLKQANYGVAVTHKRIQEVARQSACVKAISQVNFLIGECTMAVTYAKKPAALWRGRLGTVLTKGNGLQRMIRSDSGRGDMGLLALASLPGTQDPSVGEVNLIHGWDSNEDAESLRDIIHQKALLYKGLLELYRTNLDTEIMNGLAKINKRLPVPLPGCSISRLLQLRNALNEWAERVQYGTRLSRELRKYDNRSMILKFFSRFLANLRNALVALVGKNVNKKMDLQDDNEITSSIEKFDEEGTDDFEKFYVYVKDHLGHLLDINAELSSELLTEFRYSFIFVRKYPDILLDTTERILEEMRDNPTEKLNYVKELSQVLEDMELSTEILGKIFSVLISRVKVTIEEQERVFQAALKDHRECRHALVTSLPLFRNMNNKNP